MQFNSKKLWMINDAIYCEHRITIFSICYLTTLCMLFDIPNIYILMLFIIFFCTIRSSHSMVCHRRQLVSVFVNLMFVCVFFFYCNFLLKFWSCLALYTTVKCAAPYFASHSHGFWFAFDCLIPIVSLVGVTYIHAQHKYK